MEENDGLVWFARSYARDGLGEVLADDTVILEHQHMRRARWVLEARLQGELIAGPGIRWLGCVGRDDDRKWGEALDEGPDEVAAAGVVLNPRSDPGSRPRVRRR